MFRTKTYLVLTLLFGLFFSLLFSQHTFAQSQTYKAGQKKILEFGWDIPEYTYFADNIKAMEYAPFDGVVFDLKVPKGSDKRGFSVCNTDLLQESIYDFAKLNKIRSPKFTDNFIRVFVQDDIDQNKFSWYDDTKWVNIKSNTRLLAKAVIAADAKGIFLDTEHYFDPNPWSYNATLYPNQTFQQVYDKVRQRGKEYMVELQNAKPDIKVIYAFGYDFSDNWGTGGYQYEEYALLKPFLDGMLEAAGPKVSLVDGNEATYWSAKTDIYTWWVKQVKEEYPKQRIPAELVAKYKAQYQVASATVVNRYFNIPYGQAFYNFDFGFSPDFQNKWLKNSLYNHFLTTDEYVWTWSQGDVDWWKKPTFQNKQEWIDAINDAKSKIASGQAAGTVMKPAGNKIEALFEDVIPFSATLNGPTHNGTVPVGDVKFTLSANDITKLNVYQLYINSYSGNDLIDPVKIVNLPAGKYTAWAFGNTKDNKIFQTNSITFTVGTAQVADKQAPTIPTSIKASNITTNSFAVTWTASTDNVAVTGYDVFRDGVFAQNTTNTSFSFTGLSQNSTYSITVKARDAAGNISAASLPLSVKTSLAQVLDKQTPTIPLSLSASNITTNSFTATWAASTDNVAVTGYDVFKDGIFTQNTIGTSFSFTGLSQNTTYSITVKARDAAGNISAASLPLSVKTLDSPNSNPNPSGQGQTYKAGQKKLLEFGWDIPEYTFFADNIKSMESSPFDGVVFHIKVPKGADRRGFSVCNTDLLQESFFDFTKMTKIRSNKLTDNFVLTFMQDDYDQSKFSWFDDTKWVNIKSNTRLLAKAVVATDAKGIFLDTERYFDPCPWTYNAKLYPNQSFQQVYDKVRQRGKEYMIELQNTKPDIKVIYTLGYGYTQNWGKAVYETQEYALMKPFLDGMLEAAGPQVTLVDGNEPTYWSAKNDIFTWWTKQIKEEYIKDRIPAELVAKYKKQYQAASASVSNTFYNVPYGQDPFNFDYGFAPDFQAKWVRNTMYNHLLTSDEYVWSYSQGDVDWWKKPTFKNKQELVDGINDAKAKLAAGQSLGTTMKYAANKIEATFEDIAPFVGTLSGPAHNGTVPVGDVKFTLSANDASKLNFHYLYINGYSETYLVDLVKTVNLPAGKYTAWVFGYTKDNKVYQTNPITFTVGTVLIPDTQAPSVPTALIASNITTNSFTVTWVASTDNVAVKSYDVYKDGALAQNTTTTSVNLTSLNANTTYTITVKARDAANNVSATSLPLSVKTSANNNGDNQAPTPPNYIQAYSIAEKSFSLQWSGATDNIAVTGYEVFLNGISIGKTTQYATYINATQLTKNTNYNVAIKAFDAAGNVSIASYILAVKTLNVIDWQAPTSPLNLNASNITTNSLTLKWTASTDNVGVTKYTIFRNGLVFATVGGNTTSLDIKNLESNTGYIFTINASDDANNLSAFSSPLLTKTLGSTNAKISLDCYDIDFSISKNAVKSNIFFAEDLPSMEMEKEAITIIEKSATVAPNPIQNFATVTFYTEYAAPTAIRLVDGQGKIYFVQQVETQIGENQFQLDASNLPSGLLLLNIANHGHTETLKVLIQR